MIELSNGHKLEFMAASGALAYDGKGWFWEHWLRWLGLIDTSLFTIVSKTVTLKPRVGNFRWWNPGRCIRFIPGGVVNAFGLTNPGFDWWCENVGSKVKSSKINLVASIYGDVEEITEMASRLNDYELVALEINASCPNTGEDISKNAEKTVLSCIKAKEKCRLPIILKLSVVHPINEILPYLEEIVEAVSINSIPWSYIFPHKRSPFAHLGGGGVSGEVTQTYAWEMISRIKKVSSIPVIASAIWNYKDLEYTKFFGASAFAFGSVFLPRPWRPTMFVKYLKERGVME